MFVFLLKSIHIECENRIKCELTRDILSLERCRRSPGFCALLPIDDNSKIPLMTRVRISDLFVRIALKIINYSNMPHLIIINEYGMFHSSITFLHISQKSFSHSPPPPSFTFPPKRYIVKGIRCKHDTRFSPIQRPKTERWQNNWKLYICSSWRSALGTMCSR